MKFQVVQTASGWHLRKVGANGEPLWVTENYTRKETAYKAVEREALGIAVEEVDER